MINNNDKKPTYPQTNFPKPEIPKTNVPKQQPQPPKGNQGWQNGNNPQKPQW